jgi:apolipoprotein N-acyltransferase
MSDPTAAAAPPGRNVSTFFWILPAAALLLVANGRWMLPAAAWLAPLCLLRFVRTRGVIAGGIAGFAVVAATSAVVWRGLVPLPGASYLIVTSVMGLASFLPYLADRVLSPRVRGWGSSLVFPLAAVTIEYVSSSLNPYGTWASPAYTQSENLPLIQIVSVTGIWGVSFLIAWFASAVVTLVERGARDRGARIGMTGFLVVLVATLLLGGARLHRKPEGETVRVASFTVTRDPPLPIGDILRRRREGAALDSLRGQLEGLRASLFARAEREANAGAQIVFWSEANAVVLHSDVEAFLAQGSELAQGLGVHLGMAFAAVTPGDGYYENRLAIMSPTGEKLADYHKARPVPSDPERGADRHLPVVDTPLGRIAGAICFDADFPSLLRDAGEAGAGILIVPSSDWKAIDPIHTRMALVRGIENGCSIVRQTNQGLSAAADPYGRILASVDFFRSRTCVMVAQVPVRGVRTPYSRVGDLFAWLCIVALAMFAGLALRDARRRPAQAEG